MSNEKRPSTLFNYNFSSKKIRTGTENLTQDSTTPVTTSAAVTTTTTTNEELSNNNSHTQITEKVWKKFEEDCLLFKNMQKPVVVEVKDHKPDNKLNIRSA